MVCVQDSQQYLEQLQRTGLGAALRGLDVAGEDLDVRERARSALRLLEREEGSAAH